MFSVASHSYSASQKPFDHLTPGTSILRYRWQMQSRELKAISQVWNRGYFWGKDSAVSGRNSEKKDGFGHRRTSNQDESEENSQTWGVDEKKHCFSNDVEFGLHVETIFFCRYFSGISFWSLGCHHKVLGTTRTRFAKNIFWIFLNMPIPLILRRLQKIPVLSKTSENLQISAESEVFSLLYIGSKPRRTANSRWNFAQNSRCCGDSQGPGSWGVFLDSGRSILNDWSVNGRQVCASCQLPSWFTVYHFWCKRMHGVYGAHCCRFFGVTMLSPIKLCRDNLTLKSDQQKAT